MKIGNRIIALMGCLLVTTGLCTSIAWGAGYETESYDVNMVVSEDQSIRITENMAVNFSMESHGIYRTIPTSGEITYRGRDGEAVTVPYVAKIRDIETPGYPNDVETEDNWLAVRIGDPDKTLMGQAVYPLSYTATVYDDRDRDMDQLYWVLTPMNSEEMINEATFRIEMPKEFDSEQVVFWTGRYGSTVTNAVDYRIEGNTIYGKTNRPLYYGEGVTLQIQLPEGYFTGVANYEWMKPAMWILIFLAPLTAVVLWLLFGRDRKVVQTVEFYPPEGLTPAEIGYILDDAPDNCDIVSLVLYFADKGYLEIKEEGDKEFRLIKKQGLPSTAKPYETQLFSSLFEKGDTVLLSSLEGTFYESFQKVRALLQQEFSKNSGRRNYTRGSQIARIFSVLLMTVPLMAVTILETTYQYRLWTVVLLMIVPLLIALGAGLLWIAVYDKKYQISNKSKIVQQIISAVFGVAGLGAFLVYGGVYGMLTPMACAAAATVVTFGFAVVMKQRTPYSVDMLGKILGFKEFIRVAELPKIQKLVEDNPKYFYNVLPYAYVFGLTDQWAKRFEGLGLQQPDWYSSGYGGHPFSTYLFMRSIDRCASSVTTGLATMPISDGSNGGGISGGTGFSGGGFSGGGMGGGGMGRW